METTQPIDREPTPTVKNNEDQQKKTIEDLFKHVKYVERQTKF